MKSLISILFFLLGMNHAGLSRLALSSWDDSLPVKNFILSSWDDEVFLQKNTVSSLGEDLFLTGFTLSSRDDSMSGNNFMPSSGDENVPENNFISLTDAKSKYLLAVLFFANGRLSFEYLLKIK